MSLTYKSTPFCAVRERARPDEMERLRASVEAAWAERAAAELTRAREQDALEIQRLKDMVTQLAVGNVSGVALAETPSAPATPAPETPASAYRRQTRHRLWSTLRT